MEPFAKFVVNDSTLRDIKSTEKFNAFIDRQFKLENAWPLIFLDPLQHRSRMGYLNTPNCPKISN